MDRKIVYAGAIPQDTDQLYASQFAMIGLAKLAQAMFGTSTIVNGLAVTASSPASMAVNVAAGEIYELAALEASAFSSLSADTTHSILKQGISLDSQKLTLTAPTTTGYSINYLIQATYQDTDSDAATLPYYNSSNPSQPYSGPNNTATQQYTTRKGAIVVSAKAGIAATSGSQVTPSPDSGYAGLYVVTVAYGATTITASNISQYQGAPLLPAGLLQSMQNGSTNYAADSGTAANVYKVNLTPAVTTLVDGMEISFQPNYTNTGASTLSVNGLTAYPIVGGALSALQGGEIPAAGKVKVKWYAASSSFFVTASTGPRQVANAVQSQQVVAFNQITSIVGSSRNLQCSVTAASATATFTVDELTVESALGGLKYQLGPFSKTINLATTGAGGMDTGTAPASGVVAIYAIYNPTTGASALLASIATSAKASEVYSGSNMPSGYTASALISVWATTSANLFKIGLQKGRTVKIPAVIALTTTEIAASMVKLSIAGIVPLNAIAVSGLASSSATSGTGAISLSVLSNSSAVGQMIIAGYTSSGGSFSSLLLDIAQTIYYSTSSSGPTAMTSTIYISGYEI